MTPHQGERFLIELHALPSDVPPAVRLRQWLKSALRAARLRAVSVRQLPPPQGTPPGDGKGNGRGEGDRPL
jgi:hypothetical protein